LIGGGGVWISGGYYYGVRQYKELVFCDGRVEWSDKGNTPESPVPECIGQWEYYWDGGMWCGGTDVFHAECCKRNDDLVAAFFPIDECDIEVSKPTGSATVIDPNTGGSVNITASISSSSPVTWKLSATGRLIATGSGLSVSGIWDGKVEISPGIQIITFPTLFTAVL
jgi:hypothetical protein